MLKFLSEWANARQANRELDFFHLQIVNVTAQIAEAHPLLIAKIGWGLIDTFDQGADDLDALDREERRIERMPLGEPDVLSARLAVLALELPEQEDLAPKIAMRLISVWGCLKVIARRSKTPKIIYRAREMEELYFMHIRNCIEIIKGQKPI